MTEPPRGHSGKSRGERTDVRGQLRERLDRSRARAWALQVHYRWESERAKAAPSSAKSRPTDATFARALGNLIATRRISPRRLPYVRRLVDVLDARLAEIDTALRTALDNWRIERLSAIDRAVLRIGAAEILFVDEVPAKVAIQEALHLAEAYGGDESPRFVNGVLDALYKRHDTQLHGDAEP